MTEELLATAVAAARAGGEVLMEYFGSQGLEAEAKAENDLVSEADRASERAVVGEVRRRHPDHEVLSEEAGRVGAGGGAGSGHQWVIDPLDGTSNFLQSLPIFAVSVACRRGGETVAGAILDPYGEHLFTARRGGGCHWNGRPVRVSARAGLRGTFLATGYPFRAKAALDIYLTIFRRAFLEARSIRRCGSAALDLAYTAAGVFDGFFEFRLSAWDVAAGALMIEEAGGRVTDLDGGDGYLASGNVVAGGVEVHRRLLEIVREEVDEAALDRLVPPVTAAAGGTC